MSRADVEEIIDIIKKELHYVDEKSYAIPVGGYRRGKENNGDLDIILSSRSGSVSCLLDRLIDSLMGKDYLKYKLWHSTEVKAYRKPAIPSKKPGAHQTFDSFEKCFCAFLQPSKNKLRQVDLICVRPQQVVTAVLGWTGSRQFERSLRDYAKKEKSMNVSSEYIHLEEKDGSMKKISVSSEEEAFKVIGIPYLDPEMRNC
ncbi:hypothetical protein BDF20DRAFT_858641 [Mycotypha africana]|uniref:uncharacterized protein n=1 Tax=Mycotypha africana TaxID=64632 RepID=UPI0023015003|nr:uncharacterized protein BDF20DRAFT_858641 [Mycotypha africana]KAI8984213.1 hypothetical protein BDF20DRAFT_858641 [Mycotypha africana]